MDDFTRKFDAAQDKDEQIHFILTSVYEALKEKGYDPINQIVGYILSEDPTYITNHNGARTDLQGGPGRAAAGAGEELPGDLIADIRQRPPRMGRPLSLSKKGGALFGQESFRSDPRVRMGF